MCVYSGHQFDVSSKCFWNHKLPHWNWNRQSLFQKSLHRQNQQLHATALQPLHIHPFPCCHLGPRIGGGPANTVFQNVYVSIVNTFFFTHTSQISFPQMLFLVLPVRQILKHPSFTFFELLIWQLSVDDVCGDIGSKLLFQFRPQKPSPDSCCFGPMFVTNGDVETWTFPVTIAREPSFIQACVHGCSWATGELVSWLYQSGWTVVSKLYIDLVLVSTKNLPPAFAAIRLISWGVFGP